MDMEPPGMVLKSKTFMLRLTCTDTFLFSPVEYSVMLLMYSVQYGSLTCT